MSATTRDVTIAVVDEDKAARQALAAQLKQHDLNVVSFSCAAGFQRLRKPDVRYCLVIDVQLSGACGFVSQLRLAQIAETCPTIMLSSQEDPISRARARNAGAVAFLRKPANEDELCRLIEGAIS